MTSTGRAPARALPSPFVACFRYAMRVSVPPKRAALLVLPLVAGALFGLLSRVVEGAGGNAERLAEVGEGIFGLILPFACLVVGDAVLGAEVRSGAFALTWLSPTPFPTIVVARWLAGWVVAALTLVPAVALAGVAAGAPEAIVPLSVSVVAAAGAYIAVFVLVGASVQRAALWSLAIVLLGERLIGAALSGVAQLSPQWLARTAYGDLGPDAEDLLRSGVPSGTGALVRMAIVAVVALVLATWRIRSLKLVSGGE